MTDINLLNLGHPGRFLQFIDSITDTVPIVDPTHQFADSMTFQLLPASVQQQVHVYCSTGGHAGKYMVVTGENKVIAGSKSSGDSVFLRQTVAGNTTTITLSHPASDPMYYLSFDKDTREAQLELELSERSKLEVVDPNFRQGEKQDSEGLVNELDLSEGAPAQKEAESKVA